jgi:hypothetical protein
MTEAVLDAHLVPRREHVAADYTRRHQARVLDLGAQGWMSPAQVDGLHQERHVGETHGGCCAGCLDYRPATG